MMVKMFGLSIGVILLISLVAAGGVSCLNSAEETPEELQAAELMLCDFPDVFYNDTIIVIGNNASLIEEESADAIAVRLELVNLTGNTPINMNETALSDDNKTGYNLIIVGTPDSNSLLQVVYNLTNATEVTEEYPGANKGVLEILRNPWNVDKAMLLVEGSDEWGVKAAASKLEQTYSINETSVIIVELENLEDEYTIFVSSRQFGPSPGISPSAEANITSSPLERVHVLVQLYHIPNATERHALENAGVNLLTYVHNYAWFASIPRDNLAAVMNLNLVRWVGVILSEDKISLIIRESRIPPEAINADGTVNLSIMFFKDVTLDDASQVISGHAGIVAGRAPITNALVVIVQTESISAIANEDSVQWIDILPGPPIELNDGSGVLTNSMDIEKGVVK
jgi:hypothetical protein